jgi:hypothetical protein
VQLRPQAGWFLIFVNTRAGTGAMVEWEESVRLAVFADIHANRQAFSACLDAAQARGRSGSSASAREITYFRVPYDVEAAADRIRANGLPHWLADRLFVGK